MKKKNYTTYDIASLMGVSLNTVAAWIDEGKIKAFLTPGGHRRVTLEDLMIFFSDHSIPVPEELSGGLKVLIVEDDLEVMESLKEIFSEKEGVVVSTAENGYDAGEAFLGNMPDLVVLDIMLPGIDGFKVCKRMKSRNKAVKIIAITGYPSEENRKKITECGADAFLPKPFKLADLEKIISRLLS